MKPLHFMLFSVFLCLAVTLFAACGDDDDDDKTDDDTGDDDDTSPNDDDDSSADDDAGDDDTTDDDDDTSNPELDAFIIEQMEKAHIPGLAACIVKDSAIVWSNGYGWAHIGQQRPVTPDTLFQLASVSKTVTGTALMQVYDTGAFGLDDNINDYLSFNVENPHAAGTPITFRQLLTHTSSIRDNWLVISPLYGPGDSPIPLGEFLEDYLTPDGEYYHPSLNYFSYAPGGDYNYSNIGATLAGYLVESITGQPFDQYCNEHLFTPLDMPETSWRFADLDETHVAMPYEYIADTDSYRPYGQYGFPDYPDGQLRTSAVQLAHFLIAFIDFGLYKDFRMLDESTAQMMREPQVPEIEPTQGLIWYYKMQTGEILLGHNGGDFGVATEMFFRPADDVGIVMLMNGDWTNDNYLMLIALETRLFAEAAAY